jgi:hypothetical protein
MSLIQIADRSTGDVVDAELVADVSLDELVRTEVQFREFRKKRIAEAIAKGHALPASSEWDRGLKGSDDSGSYRYFGIRHQGKIQGLMMLDCEPQPSRRPGHDKQRLLYVEFIETAPWNQSPFPRISRHYGGVGTGLLRTAIKESMEAGCEGRIGLHSLLEAEGFYRPSFQDLGFDPAEDLRYFEMNEEQAQRLLRGETR